MDIIQKNHSSHTFIKVDKETVEKTLLNRCEGQFKRNGLIVNGLRYKNLKYGDKYLEGSKVIVMCAKLESELSDYEDEERKAFMEDLGLNASGLDQLIKATYDLLGLKTFFTSGEDECRG